MWSNYNRVFFINNKKWLINMETYEFAIKLHVKNLTCINYAV